MDPGTRVTEDILFEITWMAFYFAADALLDMLLFMKENVKDFSRPMSKVEFKLTKTKISVLL